MLSLWRSLTAWKEQPLRWQRRRRKDLGDNRHAPSDGEDEQRRSTGLAHPDPRAHSQRLAQQRSRCTHAVELRGLNGLSLPLTKNRLSSRHGFREPSTYRSGRNHCLKICHSAFLSIKWLATFQASSDCNRMLRSFEYRTEILSVPSGRQLSTGRYCP